MRTHRAHEIIAPWSTGAPVLDPARLGAVRIEPVMRQRRAVLALDLYLAGATGCTVIPLVLAEPSAIVERDRDPLVFPHGTPGGDAFAAALAERILPHLEALILSGVQIVEHVLHLAPAPAFDAARAAGCFGAAPLRDTLSRLAPYRYARRFTRTRTVRIDAPDAIGGWALLRDSGTVGVAAARRIPAELAWYGEAPLAGERADVAIVAADADATACDAPCVIRLDVNPAADSSAIRLDGDAGRSTAGRTGSHQLIVEVIDPLPVDGGIVFDPAAGPARRWFAVERAPAPLLRAVPDLSYAAAGGSTGRIVVILGRADALLRPSADTDEARALAAALAAEGFDAVVAASPDELGGADLIHLVGTRDGRRARAVVESARRAGVPVAVHAHDEDAASGGWWGAEVARYCFEYGDDERDVRSYLAMLARRAVAVGAARADVPYAPAEAAVDDVSAALRDASVVFAATEEEAAAIRARTGRRGPIAVVPPLAPVAAPDAIGALTGADRFALVHAPIGPVANQLLVAHCAAGAAIPLVLAGPVADASYLERVREFGGPALVVRPGEPSAGVAAALRSAAAVVVDAAWVGDGGARLAASALAGARLAVAARRRFTVTGVEPRRFDPADAHALTRALGEAWDDALRTPGRTPLDTAAALAPGTVIRSIVRGYAAIATAAQRVS
ncbi:MAG: hypothetical protein QOJ39_1393 [Candidatus Eremiobacteraeota bacterium]|jgi:hypothetical protein|nr:hypothetical protein [Candidatus Eremiobacteraeota bacterium]